MTENNQDEIRRWHRWFAVECNNRAWNLAAASQRNEREDREMLNAAYAAAYHWSQVGEPINNARAELLQAHAASSIG